MSAPLHVFTPAIVVHTAAACGALLLGAWMLLARKGSRAHRAAGWTWVGLMLAVVVSSAWIRGLNGDAWSWIHGLSVFTPVAIAWGVGRARRHEVAAHRRVMAGVYLSGLLVAGAFTLLPSRLLGHALWTALGLA